MKKTINVYNAGALFSEAEQNQRKKESLIFQEKFPKNFKFLNPIDFDFNSKSSCSTVKSFEIFKKDYTEIKKSKYVIFDIDSRDEGTFMEFGFAFEQCLTTEKYLIVIFSDFRYGFKLEYNEIPGYSRNEMITGSFDFNEITKKRMFKVTSFKAALKKIKELENIS